MGFLEFRSGEACCLSRVVQGRAGSSPAQREQCRIDRELGMHDLASRAVGHHPCHDRSALSGHPCRAAWPGTSAVRSILIVRTFDVFPGFRIVAATKTPTSVKKEDDK